MYLSKLLSPVACQGSRLCFFLASPSHKYWSQRTWLMVWISKPCCQDMIIYDLLFSGDILLASVRDHYTTLHYKTLAGFVWVNRWSQDVKWWRAMSHVWSNDQVLWRCEVHRQDWWRCEAGCGQSPENFVTEVRRLRVCSWHYRVFRGGDEEREAIPAQRQVSARANQKPEWGPSANESAALFRNDTIMSKWSVSVDRRVYPPHCTGWMYVTTPRWGNNVASKTEKFLMSISESASLLLQCQQ